MENTLDSQLSNLPKEENTTKSTNRLWACAKSVIDFMVLNRKPLFSAAISFSLASSFFCLAFALIPVLRHYNSLIDSVGKSSGDNGHFLYHVFFFHFPSTVKFFGIVCTALFSVGVINSYYLQLNPITRFSKLIKQVKSHTWRNFVQGFILVLILNAIIYKDVFSSYLGGEGFFELEEFSSAGYSIFTEWVNHLVNFLKSLVPYTIGSLIVIHSLVSEEDRKKIALSKVVGSAVILCIAVDVLLMSTMAEVFELIIQPVAGIFKSESFSRLFTWAIYLPFVSFFVLLFVGVFKATLEFELDANGISLEPSNDSTLEITDNSSDESSVSS